MINEEKFKVLQHIRELILRVDANLINYPKREIEIKQRIRQNCYDLLEIVYEANITSEVSRKIKLLEKGIAKVKIIDFLLSYSLDKKLITSKKYLKLGEKMNDIIKYITGWLRKTIP